MPWHMSIDRPRELRVELRRGVEGEEWDELLDAIIQELPNVDRVSFVGPTLSTPERQLLDTLEQVLTMRGLEVERREVS